MDIFRFFFKINALSYIWFTNYDIALFKYFRQNCTLFHITKKIEILKSSQIQLINRYASNIGQFNSTPLHPNQPAMQSIQSKKPAPALNSPTLCSISTINGPTVPSTPMRSKENSSHSKKPSIQRNNKESWTNQNSKPLIIRYRRNSSVKIKEKEKLVWLGLSFRVWRVTKY